MTWCNWQSDCRASRVLCHALAVWLTGMCSVQAGVLDGLLSYWPLDVENGASTPDAAFSNTMRVVGSPAISPGQFGSGFTFDGTTTYLTNLHGTSRVATGLPIYNAGSYTIAMWVQGPPQTNNYLFSEGSTSANNPILILQTAREQANSNKFDIIIRNDTGSVRLNHAVSSSIVLDNSWHHLAWVDNYGSATLYVDGFPDAGDFNYTPSGTFTMNTTAIGSQVRAAISVNSIFIGEIDEVAIWERALNLSEVQQVIVQGISGPISKLPYLVSEPRGGIRQVGEQITFAARAAGNRPFTYQWFRNGASLPGATNDSFTLTNLHIPNSADYTIKVSNPSGSVTSRVARLSVQPAPSAPTNVALRFPDFSSRNGLAFHGATTLTNSTDGNVLRLVPAQTFRVGSAFTSNKVSVTTFSSFFTFRYTAAGGFRGGADGIVFVATGGAQLFGKNGGGMGYQSLTNSVGVEFDIFDNGGPVNNDGNASHVAIDVGGNFDAALDEINSSPVSPDMKNGDRLFAWIDYNGAVLEARVNRTGLRPVTPTVSRTVNLTNEIGGPVALVGFTAATGSGYANHDVLSWQFNSTYDPILALLPAASIQMYPSGNSNVPGLNLTGSVGSTYEIQYADHLGGSWSPLIDLVLTSNPMLWLDQTSPIAQMRFYRVVPR